MFVRLLLRAVPFCAVVFSIAAQGLGEDGAEVVELFPAIESGKVDVTLIPRDSKRVTIQFANKTDQPLSIKLPATFAGVPVLAQFLPVGGFPAGNQGGNFLGAQQQQGPQAVGGPFGGNQQPFGQGLFNIPPHKVIKAKLSCVCLEHGKPDPKARIPYRIKPLESQTDRREVREVLELLGRGRCSQRVAQIAAWHFANGMSWPELAGLKHRYLNGRTVPFFSAAELQRAKALAEFVESRNAPSASSLSQGS